MKSVIRLASLLLWACFSVQGGDWPCFLGANGDAVSEETGIARSWPEGGPPELWTVALGPGFSGAAVQGGGVFAHDRQKDGTETLLCLDLDSGATKWSCGYAGEPGGGSYPGARCVPLVDGDHVFVAGTFGDLVCIDRTTHKVVWRKNYWSDFGGAEKLPRWALCQNPAVWEGLLVIAPQTESVGVVALDKETGALRWQTPALPGRFGYASPTVLSVAGEDQIVMASAGPPRLDLFRRRGRKAKASGGAKAAVRRLPPPIPPGAQGVVMGLDPRTGKILWEYKGWQCMTPIPRVVSVGEDRLFLTGAYEAGSVMIRVTAGGGGYTVEELLKTQAFGTHIHPPILREGHLYGQCTNNTGRQDGLVCMDLAGNVKGKTGREPAFDKGGMILADGLLLAIDGKAGYLRLVEATPKGYRQLAEAKVLGTQRCWAPLALSEGKLLVRDQKQLKCLDVSGE